MKVFKGYRPKPPVEYVEKGLTNSGNYPDYEGMVCDDGAVVLRWLTKYGTTVHYNNWEAFEAITGHPDYGTRIVFVFEE